MFNKFNKEIDHDLVVKDLPILNKITNIIKYYPIEIKTYTALDSYILHLGDNSEYNLADDIFLNLSEELKTYYIERIVNSRSDIIFTPKQISYVKKLPELFHKYVTRRAELGYYFDEEDFEQLTLEMQEYYVKILIAQKIKFIPTYMFELLSDDLVKTLIDYTLKNHSILSDSEVILLNTECMKYYIEKITNKKLSIASNLAINKIIESSELKEFYIDSLLKNDIYLNMEDYEDIANDNQRKEFLQKVLTGKMIFIPFNFFESFLSKQQKIQYIDNVIKRNFSNMLLPKHIEYATDEQKEIIKKIKNGPLKY